MGFEVVAEQSRWSPVVVAPRACAPTDANGFATLWLPPGRYDLLANPAGDLGYLPDGLGDCWFHEKTMDKPQRVRISPRVVTIEMKDADTGEGVLGGMVQLVLTYSSAPNDREGLPQTYFWGPTGVDGRARGRYPFEHFTPPTIRRHVAQCHFQVAAPEGYDSVVVPPVNPDLLISTTRPTFAFTVRKRMR